MCPSRNPSPKSSQKSWQFNSFTGFSFNSCKIFFGRFHPQFGESQPYFFPVYVNPSNFVYLIIWFWLKMQLLWGFSVTSIPIFVYFWLPILGWWIDESRTQGGRTIQKIMARDLPYIVNELGRIESLREYAGELWFITWFFSLLLWILIDMGPLADLGTYLFCF